MSKPTPMIIFITCSKCDSCRRFRGEDGKPSEGKEWNSNLIRKLLVDNEVRGKNKMKCSRIINIHDTVFGNKIENIGEFNIYCMIPSDIIVYRDLFFDLMADEPDIFGDSILRVSIVKRENGTMSISVEIDGNSDDDRCHQIEELVEDFFLWSHIPIEFEELRDFFRKDGDKNIDEIVSEPFKNDEFFPILVKNFQNYINNYTLYENDIKIRYGFNWFLNEFFPSKIRDLESFYPSWILMLPTEWGKGIGGLNPVYGKVKNSDTILIGTRFVSKRSTNETLEDLIKQYYSGRLALTYPEKLKLNEKPQKSVRFSIID